MKVREIAEIIERIAPLDTAMDFDNVGLLVGDYESDVSGVLLCLDVTSAVLEEAIDGDCNLIISHHPLIFNPIKRFVKNDYKVGIIAKAYENGVSVYAAHTNVDRMDNNMAHNTLKCLGVDRSYPLLDDGIGAIGDLTTPLSVDELRDMLKAILGDNLNKVVGDGLKEVGCVAMINGAGLDSDILRTAKERGAEVVVASEIKHHVMIEALELDLPLIEAGHYASEKSFIEIIGNCLEPFSEEFKVVKHYADNPYN